MTCRRSHSELKVGVGLSSGPCPVLPVQCSFHHPQPFLGTYFSICSLAFVWRILAFGCHLLCWLTQLSEHRCQQPNSSRAGNPHSRSGADAGRGSDTSPREGTLGRPCVGNCQALEKAGLPHPLLTVHTRRLTSQSTVL